MFPLASAQVFSPFWKWEQYFVLIFSMILKNLSLLVAAWSYSCYASPGNDSAGLSCLLNLFILFNVPLVALCLLQLDALINMTRFQNGHLKDEITAFVLSFSGCSAT